MNKTLLRVLGVIVTLVVWYIVSATNLINSRVLPSPGKTWTAFLGMLSDENPENSLFTNTWFSLKINFVGYILSIGTAIPFGFVLGLFKTTRRMFSPVIDSMRFIPITAMGGIFIALFGLTIWTKINFLAFGIWVYLVPVVVQRIDEVSRVHLQMMKTLGASKWQIFKYVQWMYVTSRLSDDVRILVGISWTYIIVAEMKGMTYGLGTLIFKGEKTSSPGQVYAVIIFIVLIGVTQDAIAKGLDWLIFKFKRV